MASVLASRKDSSPSRKPSKDIIDPELVKLIPSSDPDVAELAALADAPLEIGNAEDGVGGIIEESPTLLSSPRRGPSDKRKGKEPSYKAIVLEDTPGGWGFAFGDEADTGEPLTYHGYGGVKLHGWKHGEGDNEDHHGWKDDMDHHHVKIKFLYYDTCNLASSI